MRTTVIVETVSSETDQNGNRYHFAVFYNPAKGRQHSVALEVGGESNARHIAYKIAGDWEGTLCFERTLPKREWQRAKGFAKVETYEGSQQASVLLGKLFPKARERV